MKSLKIQGCLHYLDTTSPNASYRYLQPKWVFRPDYGRAIHSHDDDAEEGGPEPDPEPDGEVGHPVGEAEVHQDLLEDEDGPGAAQDGEGLPGEQAEHAPGQQMTQE